MLRPHLQEKLSEYLAGELERRQLEDVEAHLRDCAECREALDRLRRVDEALAAESSIEPSAGFASRVMGQVDQERKVFRYNVRTVVTGIAAAAAIVILLFAIRVQRDVAPPAEVTQKSPVKAVKPGTTPAANPVIVEKPPEPRPAPGTPSLSVEDVELIAHLDELENMELINEYDSLLELNTAIVAIPMETAQ